MEQGESGWGGGGGGGGGGGKQINRWKATAKTKTNKKPPVISKEVVGNSWDI